MQDPLAEPVVDFLGEEPQTAQVVDFLADCRIDGLDDSFCNEATGGCSHPLTNHSRGMVIHERCLQPGCGCERAVLTENAKRKVKQGLLP